MRKLLVALAALVVAVMAGQYGAQQAEAQAAAVDFYIEVATAGCDTDAGPTTCDVPVGSQFTVSTILNSFSGLPDRDMDTSNGYVGFGGQLNNSAAMPYQDRPGTAEIDTYWPECAFPLELPGANYNAACLSGAPFDPLPESSYTGVVMEVDYNCTASPSAGHTVTLVHSDTGTALVDDGTQYVIDTDPNETLTINCTGAPPTPTPTPPPFPTCDPLPPPWPAVDFYIEVATAGCDTDGGPTTCNVPVGTQFTVSMINRCFSGLPDNDMDTTNGYIGFSGALLNSAAMPYQDRPGTGEVDPYWPACSYTTENTSDPNGYLGACVSGVPPSGPFSESTYTGKVMEVDYNCTASPSAGHTVTLIHGEYTAILDDSIVPPASFVIDTDPDETLTINCTDAPAPTPTPPPPTPTPTPAPGQPVGGIAAPGADSGVVAAPVDGSGSSNNYALPLAAVIAGAIVALAAGGWYARRRVR